MNKEYPFDRAVLDYIANLTEERKQRLLESTLISRFEQDWPWFAEVIERYNLRDKNSPVSRDIIERVKPDPYGINSLWDGVESTEPIFEAMTLLDAVRTEIKAA